MKTTPAVLTPEQIEEQATLAAYTAALCSATLQELRKQWYALALVAQAEREEREAA